MKYTNYSYQRKKKKKNSILPIIIITVLSISIGLGLAWILYNQFFPSDGSGGFINTNATPDTQTDANEQGAGTTNSDDVDYIFLQCGYYGKKENADASLNQISSELLSFMVEDKEKFRVSPGIYPKAEGEAKMEALKKSGLEVSKMSFVIGDKNEVDKQVSAIVDGYFKIINKLGEADVKSVNTNEFKTYVQGLEVVNEGDKVDVLKNLKEHILKIPEEMTKKDIANEMPFLFNILVNYKQ